MEAEPGEGGGGGGFLLRWGSREQRAPKARPCAWVPAHKLFKNVPAKPSSGRKPSGAPTLFRHAHLGNVVLSLQHGCLY